jgi:glucose/arabinose dehydrogenase
LSRWAALGGAALTALVLALPGPASPAASHRGIPTGDGHGNFHLHKVADFSSPIYANGPKGAGKHVFVVQRRGVIKVLNGDHKAKGHFLDIRDDVVCCESERGLFTIAFPDWSHSRRFYVYYTGSHGDLKIDEFRRKRHKPFRANESTQRHLLSIRHRSAANHNGGTLQFDSHGLLYAATGDGGTGGGPAQRKDTLLGKVLRINPNPKGHRRYGTPQSNPYTGEKGRDEIFARGLRNPWRFSIDRTHIAIGDVGEGSREEIDFDSLKGARGANYGWNLKEGTLDGPGSGTPSHHDKPIHQYSHSGGRCAIVGGYVSRDRNVRALYGRYIYGDLCTGELRSLVPHTGGASGDKSLGVADQPGLVSFGEDARNRLYVVRQSGGVYRIAPG